MKIEMTLLSDALPGGGIANKGIVDREIACDKRGLPIIPSRRIKGILREAAEELEFLGVLDTGFSYDLFGRRGDSQSAPFTISDGHLDKAEDYAEFLDWAQSDNDLRKIFSPIDVLEYFTYLRSQTTVENGVAKDNSLRISRVLKKGALFKFIFRVDMPESFKENFKKVCHIVESFGSSRNRGLGEISLKFCDEKDKVETKRGQNSLKELSGLCEMAVTAVSYSQLLMTGGVNDGTESDGYILGSTLLGAFAGVYARKNASQALSQDANFERIFLSGDTVWSHLYPASGVQSYAPAPLSVRRYKDSDEYVDLALGEADGDKACKGLGESYLTCDALNNYRSVMAEMNVEYHHRRADDRGYGKALEGKSDESFGMFFQYETLERDQRFSGKVFGSARDLEFIKSLLPENGIVRLGRSRGTQYGECCVVFHEICRRNDESLAACWGNGESMIFRLLSDTILLNEVGYAEPSAEILKSEIVRVLGVNDEGKIEIISAFSKKKFVGGYLSVWNLPRIQETALAGGTILKLKNMTGSDIPMSGLLGKSLGRRTAEGFGRLVWSCDTEPDSPSVLIAAERSRPDMNKKAIRSSIPKVEKFIDEVLDRTFEKKMLRRASEEAGKAASLPGAAIGRFIDIIKNAENEAKLNEAWAALSGKPAGTSLEKIALYLFIEKSSLNVKEFKQGLSTLYDDVPISSLKNNDYVIKNNLDFADYQKYAVSFLTAMKYRNRLSKKNYDADAEGEK